MPPSSGIHQVIPPFLANAFTDILSIYRQNCLESNSWAGQESFPQVAN
jgi:hypothetical protein